MGKGLYFMLAYGVLDPDRARMPLSADEFWNRVEKFCYAAEKEGIITRGAYEASPAYLVIPASDNLALTGRALAVALLGSEPMESRYAIPLASFPQALMNALGSRREAIEVHWTRLTFLATKQGIVLPNGQWLWINEFD